MIHYTRSDGNIEQITYRRGHQVGRIEVETLSTEQGIKTLQGRMRTLLAYLETPVLIVSAAYKAAYINPAFEQAFVVTFRETLGKDLSSFLPPSAAETLTEIGEEAKSKEQSLRMVLHEGGRYFSVGISPIHDDKGRITGLVYNFTDISKERQLDQVKADFISLLLNDLREPLIEIAKSYDTIKAGLKKKSSLLSVVDTGIERTEEIMGQLEQMLYVTDSISGELRLSKTDNDPEMLVSTAVDSLKSLAGKSHSIIELFAAKGLPQLSCDRDKVMQVLIYLITEQIKATGEDETVTVGLNAILDGDPDGPYDRPAGLTFSVAQPHETLDRSDMPEFFEDDSKGPSTDPTRLAAAKIIEAHGATFSLVGIEGHGCALTVTFPF